MIISVKILLIALTALLIGVPYFIKPKEDTEDKQIRNHKQRKLFTNKETTYAAIKELDFDYHMGKLSEQDYKELRAKYEKKAIGILKELEAI